MDRVFTGWGGGLAGKYPPIFIKKLDCRARYTIFAIRRQKKLPLRGTADRQQLFQPLEPQSKLVLRDEDVDKMRSAVAAFEIADSGTGHAPTWQLPELEAICALHALDSSKFGDVLDQMLDAPAERSGVRAVQYVLVRDVPAVAQAATRVVPRCMIGRDMLSELRAPIEICKRVVDEKTTERGERGILRMTQPAELDAATEAATVKALAVRDDLDAEAAAESAAPAAPPPAATNSKRPSRRTPTRTVIPSWNSSRSSAQRSRTHAVGSRVRRRSLTWRRRRHRRRRTK